MGCLTVFHMAGKLTLTLCVIGGVVIGLAAPHVITRADAKQPAPAADTDEVSSACWDRVVEAASESARLEYNESVCRRTSQHYDARREECTDRMPDNTDVTLCLRMGNEWNRAQNKCITKRYAGE